MFPALPLLLSLAPARAQDVDAYDAHGFNLVPSDGDYHDLLATWRAETQVPRSFSLEALFEHSDSPVSLYESVDGEWQQTALIDNLYGVNLGLGYALDERLMLAASMPLWFSVEDVDGEAQPALGDARVAAPIGLLTPRDGEGVWVSVVPYLDLPTGSDTLLLGAAGVGAGGVAALSLGQERWRLSANAGTTWASPVELINLRGGLFLRGAAGASAMLTDNLAFRLEALGNRPLGERELPVSESPAALLGSLRGKAGGAGLTWTLGGGAGLTGGVGAAKYRIFAGLGWALGKAPAQTPTTLLVRVLDPHRAPIDEAAVEVQSAAQQTGEDGTTRFADLSPGRTDLAVRADLYEPYGAEIDLLRGQNSETVILTPLQGTLRVLAVDQHDDPVPARVRFLEGPDIVEGIRELGADGEESFRVPPGKWVVLISPMEKKGPNYVPQRKEAALAPGGTQTVVARFEAMIDPCEPISGDVFFDWDSYAIKPAALPLLENLALIFLQEELGQVEVQGHTDTSGPSRYNLKLSTQRAEAVREQLIRYGVPARRLKAQGYGESRLKVSTADEVREERNRRVEFKNAACPE